MWRKNSWYLGIIIILLSSCVYAISINEIMYNPSGLDTGREWIEIYNNESDIDITGWKFYEDNVNHGLSLKQGDLILENNEYAIIVDDYTSFLNDYPGFNGTVLDSSFSLSNSGENISIKDNNGNFIDSIVYSDLAREGYSLEFYGGNWYESLIANGTPGYINSYTTQDLEVIEKCDWKVEILLDNYIFNNGNDVNWTVKVSKDYGNKTNVSVRGYVKDMLTDWTMDYKPWTNESITSYRNEKYNPNLWENKFYEIFFNITELSCEDTDLGDNYNYRFIMVLPYELGQDYTKLKINELFPDPQGYDDAAMPEGEWVELYNSGDESLDLENLSLKDNYGLDMDIFISNTNTLSETIINPQSYLVIYMNGRSGFLNNDGFEKIGLYKENYLIDEVSYGGSIEGLTWGKIDNVWKLTLPTPNSENFYNESVNESELKIDSTDKEKYKFGDIANIKLHIYKGNTNKYSIQAWIEKDDRAVSKRNKVSIFTKFTEYDVTLPIQIFSNCEEEYEEGDYDIVVEGFDLRDEEEIEVEGNNEDMCKVIKEEGVKEVSKSNLGSNEKDINTTYNVEYISKEVKERRLALYFFCIILIVMLLYFGLKNE